MTRSVFTATSFAIMLIAATANAQPMKDSDISSYPESNQRSGSPNEPDTASGTTSGTYKLPTGGPTVTGTTSNRKPVVFDPEHGTASSTSHGVE